MSSIKTITMYVAMCPKYSYIHTCKNNKLFLLFSCYYSYKASQRAMWISCTSTV